MPTLLHISDLHRTSEPRLSNEDLLAAIVSDATRWKTERVPRPDLIVVSGDLIQGAEPSAPDSDIEVTAQYREAGDFLKQLADEFVDSDRSRVVIVPGNHDVHWGRSFAAMNSIKTCPDDVGTKVLQAESGMRWNWNDRQAYEISDRGKYESRLKQFREFRATFYQGLNPSPISPADEDLVFIEYRDIGLVVTGFASWHGNDCFCHVGEIASSSLASSRKRLAESTLPVAIAVWHHSIVGRPREHDYMDQRIVHRMIDFGFVVGLHGHQHYSGAAPFELRLPNLTTMVVIGAGSLAVGDGELPMGERRQFNIVVIDPESKSITVHVRAMSPAGVFTGSHRDDFGGNTSVKLDLPVAPGRARAPTDLQRLDEAMTAVAVGRYEESLELIADMPSCNSAVKRQIEIKALDSLGRKERLIELLDPPQNADEAVKLIALLLDAGRFDEAADRLQASAGLLDGSLLNEIKATIAARRMT